MQDKRMVVTSYHLILEEKIRQLESKIRMLENHIEELEAELEEGNTIGFP